MNPLKAYKLVRTLGPVTVLKRAINIAKVKTGYLERLDPAAPFGVGELSAHLVGIRPNELLDALRQSAPPFFFDINDESWRASIRACYSDEGRETLLKRAAHIRDGVLRFFSTDDYEMGRPIRWQWDPQRQLEWHSDRHWRHYGQFLPGLSDVKHVWEANRFAFGFDLLRAAVVTDDDDWLRLALDLIDEWIDANPPGLGAQWNCGQECALRLMVWHCVLRAAVGRALLDAARCARIVASIYRQTQRIDRYIGFARSIRNNHSLSEALGVYTTGVLFPWFDTSSRWKRRGRSIFESELAYQSFDDGSYIQHSFNYQRLAASTGLWMQQLATRHDDPLSPSATQRLQRNAEFLTAMMNAQSGRVPNYGPNDGARILPLTECDYLDYRPESQAAARAAAQPDLLAPGPWDELSLWLGLPSASTPTDRLQQRTSASFSVGGYYTMRSGDAFAMVRCHTYRERPTDADMLHLDLWYRGQNVLRDAGSYSYNCVEPWLSYFKSTAAHNTIEIEGANQMVKGPRFMWYEWTRSEFIGRGELDDGAGEWWEGRHFGYEKRFGVVHARRIERRGSDDWRVIDTLIGNTQTRGMLRWRLIDCPVVLDEKENAATLSLENATATMSISGGDALESIEIVRGIEGDKPDGWESLYYGRKSPLPVMCVAFAGKLPLTLETRIEIAPSD